MGGCPAPHTVVSVLYQLDAYCSFPGYENQKGLPSRPTLGHCWWGCKMEHLLLKTVWRFLKKLKTKLAYDPVTPLLDIQPNELKAES